MGEALEHQDSRVNRTGRRSPETRYSQQLPSRHRPRPRDPQESTELSIPGHHIRIKAGNLSNMACGRAESPKTVNPDAMVQDRAAEHLTC